MLFLDVGFNLKLKTVDRFFPAIDITTVDWLTTLLSSSLLHRLINLQCSEQSVLQDLGHFDHQLHKHSVCWFR